MSGEPLATVRGIPHIPSITAVNVRPGPTTAGDPAFQAPVGMSGMTILEVQPDSEGNALNGKTYQWFHIVFHGGARGWVRDDLLSIQGDLTPFGYPDLAELTFAFALTRGAAEQPQTPPEAEQETQPPPTRIPVGGPTGDQQQIMDASSEDRIRQAAFNISAAFEGGYASINTVDRGIVSYGWLQFTLQGGALHSVLLDYLNNSQSETAEKLRNYLAPVANRDPNLRNDRNFHSLLRQAATEPEMQDAQDKAAHNYWQNIVNGYIRHRKLRLPLTWALLFDMGINFGPNHKLVRMAEDDLGVPRRSTPGENGITEQELTRQVAALRKRSHDRQAAQDPNAAGLAVRGDFWWDLVTRGDWGLQGDANGNVVVFGRQVQVRMP